jgi:GntR family transcriptional regulator
MLKQRKAPQYQRIAAELRAQIDTGELRRGEPFPSVREIAAHYKVAPTTAHAVIKLLRDAGEVETGPAGTRVSMQPTASSPGERLARVASGGRVLRVGETAVIRTVERVDAPPASVLDGLGLEPGQGAVRRSYTVYGPDDQAVYCGESWFPAELADRVPELTGPEPIPDGAIGAIRRRAGLAAAHVPGYVTSRGATADERELLGISPAEPWVTLVVTRCVTAQDEAVEYAETAYPPGYRVILDR